MITHISNSCNIDIYIFMHLILLIFMLYRNWMKWLIWIVKDYLLLTRSDKKEYNRKMTFMNIYKIYEIQIIFLRRINWSFLIITFLCISFMYIGNIHRCRCFTNADVVKHSLWQRYLSKMIFNKKSNILRFKTFIIIFISYVSTNISRT